MSDMVPIKAHVKWAKSIENISALGVSNLKRKEKMRSYGYNAYLKVSFKNVGSKWSHHKCGKTFLLH